MKIKSKKIKKNIKKASSLSKSKSDQCSIQKLIEKDNLSNKTFQTEKSEEIDSLSKNFNDNESPPNIQNFSDSDIEDNLIDFYDFLNPSNEGHFLFFDNPLKIVGCNLLQGEVFLAVEWKMRSNGCKPKNTTFSSKALREYDKDLLIEFYESKLKFTEENL